LFCFSLIAAASEVLTEPNMAHGCQIFLRPKYQKGKKYTKLPKYIPNVHKIFPMAVK
jgi:hypothetical protein